MAKFNKDDENNVKLNIDEPEKFGRWKIWLSELRKRSKAEAQSLAEDGEKEIPISLMIKSADFFTDRIEIAIWEPIRRALKHIGRWLSELRSRHLKDKPKKAREAKRRIIKLYRYTARLRSGFRRADDAFAAFMVRLIQGMDSRNDDIADKAAEAAEKSTRRFNFIRERAERNKKKLLIGFAAMVLALFGAAGALNYVTAYEYSYNGRTLGMVDDQQSVIRILDLVSEQLSKEHNAEIAIDPEKNITFKRVISLGKDVDDSEQVLKRLTYMQDMTAKGYAIYIDGTRVAILDSKASAQAVLDNILSSYMTESEMTTYEEVGFAEDIKIKSINTKLGQIENVEDAAYKILTGAESVQTHIVQAGETFSGIAKMYNISMADLMEANPLVTPERLRISQEIVLTKSAPMLTVQTVEVTTANEVLPYSTTYENSASMYQGETSTKVAGVNGTRHVTRKIVKNNGVEVASIELESKILSRPSSAVVLVGTKALPAKKGTGTFIYPVSGAKLSSKFGKRWGRMHYGIDLACATGTKIKASDGGTVTFSGYSGSYGYVVKIDHGGGYVTVYAHCSKLLVKSGEKVYQGQHIANVGSTGRSTGPHCHFEIQYMGVQKNPLNYL